MRTFIAVELDGATREAVVGLAGRVARAVSGVRWVKPDNIHITIRFLGEISPETRDLVERVLRNAALEFSPFGVTVEELGAFPSLRKPRVLWVGIGRGKKELRSLHSKIEKKLAEAGIPAEKRSYKPHITIGRLKRPPGSDKLADIVGRERVISSFVVDKVVLFKSELRPEGAVHSAIYEASLKRAQGQTPERIESADERE